MNVLKVHLDFGTTVHEVGELYLSEKLGRYAFAYATSFLSSGIEISPIGLPLGLTTHVAERDNGLYDLHGVFADSLPDEWGRKVQDAEFEKIGLVDPTALDRLAFIGRYALGALRYEPAQSFKLGPELVTLAALRKATQSIIRGDADDIADQLMHCGGSAGGARPKYLVDLNSKNHNDLCYNHGMTHGDMVPVVLKVPVGGNDRWQRVEYVYCLMAEQAGLSIPETFLIVGSRSKQAHFAIKRFDILPNGKRLHLHTYAGLLGLNFREARSSYSELLRTTAKLTLDHREVVEMYRRMVFNVLGNNKDDHARNFTFTMTEKGSWGVSPAYDIGYSSGDNGLHYMPMNGKRRNFELADFKQIADDFDIREWKAIIERTCESLENWKKLAARYEVPSKLAAGINERIGENVRRLR